MSSFRHTEIEYLWYRNDEVQLGDKQLYRNLWIAISPVGLYPPPILTYICLATSANYVCVQYDAPNCFVSTTSECWYMTLRFFRPMVMVVGVIDASVLVFVRKKDYTCVNRVPHLLVFVRKTEKYWRTWGISSELLVGVLHGEVDARTPLPQNDEHLGGYSYPQITVVWVASSMFYKCDINMT